MKILFLGDTLASWALQNSSRSGLFVVAYNILNQFQKQSDFEIYILVTNKKQYSCLKEMIIKEFSDSNLKILKGYSECFFTQAYFKCRNMRIFHRENKNLLRKILWSAVASLLKPISILENYLYARKMLEKNTLGFDYLFSPYSAPPKYCAKMKKCTVLHDTIPLIFPHFYVNNKKFLEMLSSINRNDFYFTVSEAAKRDFLKYCPQIDPEKITVTPLACNERFVPADKNAIAQARKKYNIPEGKKYVFSLCTLEPRKNLIRAVKTFVQFIKKNNIDDLVFVLGGGHWEHFIGKLKNEIADLGEYQNKIIRAGYIDDEDVPRLYSGAQWFVFTSQYEGFGLPPLEAMNCGCPVITSNNSSLPEVVGDAGIMIDFDSDEQHIKAYEDFYYDSLLRDEYSSRGLARAKCFSWKKCADQMINEMKRSLNK